MVGNLCRKSEKMEEIVRKIEEEFMVTKEKLKEIADKMEETMRKGLIDESGSSIKMLVSFVESLPTGHEAGRFYALDLGGTNLRVMQVKLQGNKTINLRSDSHMVPPELKVGKLHDLFEYIAKKVCLFIEAETDANFRLLPGQIGELGFTFSFPVHQLKISSGNLLNWTKDFDLKDAIGKDIALEMTKALEKEGVPLKVTALLNDTVGTLAGGRFYDKNVDAAVILGTGTNAAYVEKAENILKPYGPPPKSGQMVINTEWGNFDSSLPLTDYDRALDDDSPNKKKQLLEKMLSGRYLGEIVRRILLRLAEDGGLFGCVPAKLREHNILGTDIVSAMHDDKTADLSVVGKTLQNVLELPNVSSEEKKLIVKVCNIAATRGARLSAAAILAVLKRLGKDKAKEGTTVIAVDGSLFGKYQHFNACLQKTLKEELLDGQASKTVSLQQFKDASGVGAALIAASHSVYR